MARWREVWPCTALLLGMALVLAAGGEHWLTLPGLAARQVALADWAAAWPPLAPFAAIGAAAAAALLAVPGEGHVAFAAGALFGAPLGALLTALGATLGASALMLAARRALRPALRKVDSRWLIRAETAIQRDGIWWLLALRLACPFAPFLVTLLASALGARLRPFALATGLGSLPAAFATAHAGAFLTPGGAPAGDPLAAWPMPALLAGLALAALLPILAAAMRRREP